MNDTQLYFAAGLPCLAVIASLVVSLIQISAIREDIREICSGIKISVGKLADIDTRVSLQEHK